MGPQTIRLRDGNIMLTKPQAVPPKRFNRLIKLLGDEVMFAQVIEEIMVGSHMILVEASIDDVVADMMHAALKVDISIIATLTIVEWHFIAKPAGKFPRQLPLEMIVENVVNP